MAFSMVPWRHWDCCILLSPQFSVLEVTGIGAAAAILPCSPGNVCKKEKGLTDQAVLGRKGPGLRLASHPCGDLGMHYA